MSDIAIRKATAADLETIVLFNQLLARETEEKELEADVLTDGVRALLNDSARGEYYVAEADGRVIGQLMYTREWSDWRNGDLLWLQSVYVHADYRRQGVFGRLLEKLRELARSRDDVAGLRLYVEEQNQTAQATYLRHGFVRPGYLVMESLGSDRA